MNDFDYFDYIATVDRLIRKLKPDLPEDKSL
jgi:hypothetical protein